MPDDRIAVITGANRGMGLETARQLLSRGLKVALTGRNASTLERARRSLDAPDDRALGVELDVTDPASIAAACKTIEKRWGRVDVLVNNAAVLMADNDDVLSISADVFRATFDTNLFGVIETCRVFVPGMAERHYGRVVNVSSGAGQISTMSTYAPAYSLSKVALNALTKILAETYRRNNVLVNTVDPGWVRTDMGGRSAPRSVEKGVETTVWLATLPDAGPTGGFFKDRHPIAW